MTKKNHERKYKGTNVRNINEESNEVRNSSGDGTEECEEEKK